jgi:hypothetical protein
MTPLYRGIAVAALHCALVLSIAGKYAMDRERLPRAWARTVNYDPEMPIRGRYISLRLAVDSADLLPTPYYGEIRLSVRNGTLIVAPTATGTGERVMQRPAGGAILGESVPFFLPEHAPDPTRRARGEELWVEVSVPRRGPPRPIRLGVKKDGVLTPLELR